MQQSKKLIVIGEPEVESKFGSRNNAMNEILEEYKNHHSEVFYISGTNTLVPGDSYIYNGVNYLAICRHSKSNRVILKDFVNIIRTFKSVYEPDVHVQFRVPSIFTLQLYFLVSSLLNKKNISFYIAGDWKQSLKHNYPNKKLMTKLLPSIQNLIIKNKKCVCTGKALATDVGNYTNTTFEFYSTTHKICDIKNVNKFELRNICFIGRIEKLKNYQFFVNLSQKDYMVDNYIFHILGDGPESSQLIQSIASLKNVVYHGHLSNRADVQELVDSCKYFILPSYTEGTSKTLPEAMARSTVPIAFKNVGANNYIIKDNGLLVDIDDYNAIVEYIKSMDTNVEMYKKTLRHCTDYAESNSIDKQVGNMFEFIYG